MSMVGFAFCGMLSVFMPPPANPASAPGQAIGQRLHLSADAQALLKRSCYDCHSNETHWPAYSRLWPASALIYSDVSKGRETMNFSDWPDFEDPHQARRAAGLLMASCAAMQIRIMPRQQYLMLHPEAKVSAQDAQQFCAWTATAVAALRR